MDCNCKEIADYLNEICEELFPELDFIVYCDDESRWGIDITTGKKRTWVVSYLYGSYVPEATSSWYAKLNKDSSINYAKLDMVNEEILKRQLKDSIELVIKNEDY